jgi:GAF domain-containing protein
VVETREPVVLPDVAAADAVNVEWIRAQRFVSAAILPLIGDQCVGALAVVTRTRREFDDDELQILRAFAEHAAIAVEKAARAGSRAAPHDNPAE